MTQRVLTAVVSALAIIGIVAGVPAALLLLVGNPLPESVPNWANVARSLESGVVPPAVMANLVALVVWLWWLQVALALAAECVAVVRGRTARRLLFLPGAQFIGAKLVAALLVGFTGLGAWSLAGDDLGDPKRLILESSVPEDIVALVPEEVSDGRVIATGAGASLFAAGLVIAIRRLRRVQRRRRRDGEHVRRPPSEARATEASLNRVVSLERMGFVGSALAVLDDALEGHDPPPIVGISHSSDSVTILLERRAEAPPPFTTVDDGFAWEIGPESIMHSASTGWSGRAPEILVTAGRHGKSGSEVLLNLAHPGHLGVGGVESDVLPILTTMAAELATSPFAESLEVVCIGFGSSLADLERLRVAGRLSDVLDELEHDTGSSEPLVSTVVIDPYSENEEALARLGACIGDGVVAITAHGESRWKLACKRDTVTLWPFDLTLQRGELDEEAIGHLQEIVEAAVSPLGQQADPAFEVALRDLALPTPEAEICVLGAVQVRGIDDDFSSRTALALVTYLAFHRDGATPDQLKRWLWHPDSPPNDKLFANTISRARTTLGMNSSGELHLPRLGSDRLYRLAESVGTDVDRFRAFLDAAEAEPSESRRFLRKALELVRGLVFAGGDDQPFAWVDHTIRSHIEFMVDETAHRLADEALAAGDAGEARWAALAGLRLIPDCESCFRRRFLAADMVGNRTELKRAMAELRRLVAVDASLPDSSDLISPELEGLYADLLAGRPAA